MSLIMAGDFQLGLRDMDVCTWVPSCVHTGPHVHMSAHNIKSVSLVYYSYIGSDGVDGWDKDKWFREFSEYQASCSV